MISNLSTHDAKLLSILREAAANKHDGLPLSDCEALAAAADISLRSIDRLNRRGAIYIVEGKVRIV